MSTEVSEVMTTLGPMVEALSAKLGIAASKIWEWAVLSVYVDLSRIGLFLLITLTACWLVYRYSKWLDGEIKDYHNKEGRYALCDVRLFAKYKLDDYYIVKIILFITVIIMICVCICTLFSAIGMLVNPEWYALKAIINELSRINL